MSDESLCVTARRAHVNATAAPAQQVPLVPLHCSAPHEPQVMVDRFDARLLLTQNDAQSLREHASLDGTGVVVSSVEQEDLDLSSEENILNAERYRSLPGTRWFIDDEKSDDEQSAPTQGIASPPTDANGEDVTDEWAHVASTTPPSWLWFDVDAQTTPRVPQHIQTHAAICAAAKRVREEGGQSTSNHVGVKHKPHRLTGTTN